MSVSERLGTLTPRERQVFEQVVAGRLNKQIAAELGIVEKTIKVHRARVMRKMQANSLVELVHLAAVAGVDSWSAPLEPGETRTPNPCAVEPEPEHSRY
jgi:FixJ family two-component response regulator